MTERRAEAATCQQVIDYTGLLVESLSFAREHDEP